MNISFRVSIDDRSAYLSLGLDQPSSVAAAPPPEPAPVEPEPDPAPAILAAAPQPISRRRATVHRFIKVCVFTGIGIVLPVLGYVTLTGLTGLKVPEWVITPAVVVVSGLAAAIHKAVNWQEMGIEAPDVPDAVSPPLTLPQP